MPDETKCECPARKALVTVRELVYQAGYAVSMVDNKAAGNCAVAVELIDAAYSAPCPCDELLAGKTGIAACMRLNAKLVAERDQLRARVEALEAAVFRGAL